MLMQNFWGVNKVHYGKWGSGVLRFPRRLLHWCFEACWCWLHKTRPITNNSLIYSCWLFQSVLWKTHPKRFTFFFLLPAQGSLQFLSLDLDYNNNNFICTKRLSVVQFGCLLDVRRSRGAALDQKGTEMDDALNFIILWVLLKKVFNSL